jgi:hypothetical protein
MIMTDNPIAPWDAISNEVALPAPAKPPKPNHDERGRFVTGNSGGGRRKGARGKLSELFLTTIADDFAKHGPATIERVRQDDPAAYLKAVASLVPRQLILEREREIDYSKLSREEIIELLEREQRNEEVQKMIDCHRSID